MAPELKEKKKSVSPSGEGNRLFPVFLKLEQLHLLIVGGGKVGHEKLRAVLENSPRARVTVVARKVSAEVRLLASASDNVEIYEREYHESDLEGKDLVIVAVDDRELGRHIRAKAAERKLLVNVADTPDLCDFYLGSIVKKGEMKIAISTNGKSPTISKRMKQVLDEAIPAEINQSIEQVNRVREKLKGNLEEKVVALNKITAVLAENNLASLQPHLAGELKSRPRYRQFKYILLYSLSVLALMTVGHILFSYISFSAIGGWATGLFSSIDRTVLIFIAGGFIAQMVDGALGMAYGVTATTFLLSFGITPAAASASVHASEIFTTGASGLMHLRFKNVNTKLFRSLLLPGILGAILGAYILSSLEEYSSYLKPMVAVYTMVLGILIIAKAIKKVKTRRRIKRVGGLAFAGAFLDSIGGGGWGPIVSSTLIARGRSWRYTIGSVNLAEFFITLTSSLTFFTIIGIQHWYVILGLIIGGVIAAPLAALMTSRIPVRAGLITVGVVVIIVSLRIIYLFFFK